MERYEHDDLHPASHATVVPANAGTQSNTSREAHDLKTKSLDPGVRPDDEVVDRTLVLLRQRYNAALRELSHEAIHLLRDWPARYKSVTADVNEYKVRDKTIRVENYRDSLSHQKIPKVSPPKTKDWATCCAS